MLRALLETYAKSLVFGESFYALLSFSSIYQMLASPRAHNKSKKMKEKNPTESLKQFTMLLIFKDYKTFSLPIQRNE